MRQTISFFCLVISALTMAGCGSVGKTPTPSNSSAVIFVGQATSGFSATSSMVESVKEIIATSTIEKNNPTIWPRHYFKELGFSIKLPFAIGAVKADYRDCTKPEDRCDTKDMYSFDVAFQKNTANTGEYYVGFLGSTSPNFSYDKAPSITNDVNLSPLQNGLTVNNLNYIKIVSVNGVAIPIFDVNKGGFLYEHMDDEPRNAAIIKLPSSKKFKAAVMIFAEEDASQEQFVSILKTIRFDY